MTKKCTKCSEELDISQFPKDNTKSDGYYSTCKLCRRKKYNSNRESILKQKQEYYSNNKSSILESRKKYIIEHKDTVTQTTHKYYKKNRVDILSRKKEYQAGRVDVKSDYDKEYYIKNKDTRRKQNRAYRISHKDELRIKNSEYIKNKLKTDPEFKLFASLRDRTRKAIKNQYGKKAYRTIELLGCTIEEARAHLESQFQDGMTWDNHGTMGWHIDHIKPCASFDLTDPIQQKACFNYTNLQPLWAEDNLKKSNKLI